MLSRTACSTAYTLTSLRGLFIDNVRCPSTQHVDKNPSAANYPVMVLEFLLHGRIEPVFDQIHTKEVAGT